MVIVLAARFDQQHAVAAVGAQAVGQQGAGRAPADDDGVKRGVAHGEGAVPIRGGNGGPLCGWGRPCR